MLFWFISTLFRQAGGPLTRCKSVFFLFRLIEIYRVSTDKTAMHNATVQGNESVCRWRDISCHDVCSTTTVHTSIVFRKTLIKGVNFSLCQHHICTIGPLFPIVVVSQNNLIFTRKEKKNHSRMISKTGLNKCIRHGSIGSNTYAFIVPDFTVSCTSSGHSCDAHIY